MKADLDLHDHDATTSIAAELVRLTLGQRGASRPELHMGIAASLARIAKNLAELQTAIGEAMLPVLANVNAALVRALNKPT